MSRKFFVYKFQHGAFSRSATRGIQKVRFDVMRIVPRGFPNNNVQLFDVCAYGKFGASLFDHRLNFWKFVHGYTFSAFS